MTFPKTVVYLFPYLVLVHSRSNFIFIFSKPFTLPSLYLHFTFTLPSFATMSSRVPPRTPPRRTVQDFLLLTPPTPRYAPIYEPDLFAPDHKHIHNEQPHNEPTLLPLTPEQTPVRKSKHKTNLPPLTGRVLFPSTTSTTCPAGSTHKIPLSTLSPRIHKPRVLHILHETSETHRRPVVAHDLSSTSTTPSTSTTASRLDDSPSSPLLGPPPRRHPYDPADTTGVPGMWHVFRGKKIFRPYAKGVSSLEDYTPRVLFGPKKDDKSLESCTRVVPKKPLKFTSLSDPFMPTRSARTVRTARPTRPSTPEIDSDDEDTDQEDLPVHVPQAPKRLPRPPQKHFFR